MHRSRKLSFMLLPCLFAPGAPPAAGFVSPQTAPVPCPPCYASLARQALEGDRQAVSRLAPCYAHDRDEAVSLTEAAPFVHAAALRGLPEAQFVWGMMLLTGEGATEDTAAALSWIERAAEQGYPPAVELFEYVLNHDEPLAC